MTVNNDEKTKKDTRFKPGNKLGKGRPKKEYCIPDILNRIGDEEVTDKSGNTLSKREFVLRAVYNRAVKGENWAVQFIADRTEGKAIERIISREGDMDIVIE